MAGKLRIDQVQNANGTGGLFFNVSTNNIELQAAGFNLSFDSINIVPQGKTRVTFSMLTTDQSWTVPGGISYIYAKLWGSGGGGGGPGWTNGSFGGGGGFSRGIIPVTAGESLIIRVPRGGYTNPGATNAPFGGGSSTGGGDNQYGAGGGGYCAIFRGSTPLAIAGAGGGGGAVTGNFAFCNGGAGGGLRGMRGESARNVASFAGGGGNQTTGGTAGNGGNAAGGAGSYLQGGSVQNANIYGGGGGGGYYGGGSGSYGSGNTMGGGGGGSGYIAPSVIFGNTYAGNGPYPAGIQDIDYPDSSLSTYTSVGYGGNQNNHGGDGYIVIYY